MAKEGDNGFGIMAVIFGILSIVFSTTILLGSFGGIALGILGIIFALIQKKKSKNKWVRWGIILSIIGIIIGVIFAVLLISALAEFAQQIQELQASGALDVMQGVA